MHNVKMHKCHLCGEEFVLLVNTVVLNRGLRVSGKYGYGTIIAFSGPAYPSDQNGMPWPMVK